MLKLLHRNVEKWAVVVAALTLPAFASLHAKDSAVTSAASNASAEAQTKAKAKNVILFIGDGMGVSTVTAARIYEGQKRGEKGEENLLSFEKFPNVALVKTYNTNQQVPDSAGTATAMHTGVKTRAGVIGIGPAAKRQDCGASKQNELELLGDIAAKRGKAIGIVSTARITHATPAAVYAHSPERDWEADSKIPAGERAKGCIDIASQLADFPFHVALGGGRRYFYGKDGGGRRLNADANLPTDWAKRTGGKYVEDAAALKKAPKDKPLLGLFHADHMTYMLDRKADSNEPTLTDMTAAALGNLSGKKQGYYLMVESGRIDHGHHQGQAGYALEETGEFARAIAYAVANTNPDDTMILVTADHSHVFTIAGYPTRGNPILGLVHGNDDHGDAKKDPELALDGKPYTTLGYANGPGAIRGPDGQRPVPKTGPDARQQATVPTFFNVRGRNYPVETHAGEDVALYASGAGSDQVRGVIEQNRIFDYIVNAFGWEK